MIVCAGKVKICQYFNRAAGELKHHGRVAGASVRKPATCSSHPNIPYTQNYARKTKPNVKTPRHLEIFDLQQEKYVVK